MSLYCTKCGKELEDGARFCPSCGTAVSDGVSDSSNASAPFSGAESVSPSFDNAGGPASMGPGAGSVGVSPAAQSSGAPKKKRRIAAIVAAAVVLFLAFCIGVGSCSDEEPEAPSEPQSAETSSDSSTAEGDTVSLKSIKATYAGSTEAGTKINSESDITVVATYDDGSTDEVVGWKVSSSKTLKAGKTSTVVIEYGGMKTKLKVKCTTKTKEQFKKGCKSIAYKSIARNPDKYEYKQIRISGKVIQVIEGDGNDVTLRVATSGGYDNVYLVSYEYQKKDNKILEDDRVTLWGYCTGTTTYQSTMGGNITVPSMVAMYYSIS